MKLRLKEECFVLNQNGTKVTNAVIEAFEEHTDRFKTKTVKVGVFDGSVTNPMENYEPLKVLTWEFTKEPELPTKDAQGNLLTTGHSGSVAIAAVMDFMKVEEDGTISIITPKTRKSQLWILAQKYDDTYLIGDLFEFEGGLLPIDSNTPPQEETEIINDEITE